MTDNLQEQKGKIKQLQRYIREIAINDTRIPILSIDGQFLDETQNAISAFQTYNQLPITGEADEDTWNEIFSQYSAIKRATAPPIPVNIFKNPDATLKIGATGYTIYFVQTMLKSLSEKYYNIENVKITGVYDAQTERAIQQVRKATGVDENMEIDKYSFDALTWLFNAAEK